MIIGLTGGIASGKSEIARYLKKLGAYIIDADLIAREVTARGTLALKEIVKSFSKGILYSNGVLNRQKLAEIIFSDKKKRLELEEIAHPYINAHINKVITHNKLKHNIVINAPLLFECGLDKMCDKTIVVWVPYDIQAKRLSLRDNLNKEQVHKRICSQMPIEQKLKLANFIIDNTGSKKDLEKNVTALYEQIILHTKL